MTRRGMNTMALEMEPLFDLKLPHIKPLSFTNGALIFGGIAVVGTLAMGAVIGTYVFFGIVTLGGLIAIIESNKYLKYFVVQGNKLVDITIFIATIYATAVLGVTVAASLTVAGLGYTLVYAPILRRNRHKNNQDENQNETNES